MHDMSGFVWSGDDMTSSPETMPMGAPDISGNSPTLFWGQNHRISGKPWFRNPRQSHEEMMGVPVGDHGLGEDRPSPVFPWIEIAIGAALGWYAKGNATGVVIGAALGAGLGYLR